MCRKMAAEILVFFCHWDAANTDRVGLSIVLRTFEQLEVQHNSTTNVPGKVSKFERWMRQTEEFVVSRGRMGSTVGAQQAVRGMDAQSMTDYCVSEVLTASC
jgi:cytokinesis protein